MSTNLIESKAFNMPKQVCFMKQDGVKKEEMFLMVQADRYQEALIPLLEAYVSKDQMTQKYHDLEANLLLLNLYKMYPERAQKKVVAVILMKALMSLPFTHYTAVMYMIPYAMKEDEDIKKIAAIAHILESAKFTEFWTADLSIFKDLAGFEDAVRAFIVVVISLTYDCINANFLQEQLNLDKAKTAEVIKAEGWTITDGYVAITPNSENTVQVKKFKESIEFSQMLNVVNILSK